MRHVSPFVLAALFMLTACGGADAPSTLGDVPAAPNASAAAADEPPRTGTVHTIDMIMNDEGNFFQPADVEARPGDVLRFVLASGVHNVSFPTDSNPGVSGLPPAGPMLQLPGQATEFVVPDAVGKRIFYQCDPHALLGMVGHITVMAP